MDQVTQSLETASISDPIEYATQGRGMLTYPLKGPDLDGETFKNFWIAAHKNKAVNGASPQVKRSPTWDALATLAFPRDLAHRVFFLDSDQ